MLTNKWVLFALSTAIALLGYFGTVNWNTLLPSEAGGIISGIAIAKMVLNSLMPPPGQSVITSTGGTILTHTCMALLGTLLLGAALFFTIGGSPASAMALDGGGTVFFARTLPTVGSAIMAALLIIAAFALVWLSAGRIGRFFYSLACVLGIIAVGGLTACTTTGTLTPAAQNDVTTALGTACPVLATLAGQKLSAIQNGAYNTLSIACPPNAPPTNAVQVALDLMAAYNILSPLVK